MELRCAIAEERAAQLQVQVLEYQIAEARAKVEQVALAHKAVAQTVADAYGLQSGAQINLETGEVLSAEQQEPTEITGVATAQPRGQA